MGIEIKDIFKQSEDIEAEKTEIYLLFKGMSESMQKAVKDIMLATQEEKE